MSENIKQYKYETHMHTSESSPCSRNSAKEMVLALYEQGYSGVVVTDHFNSGNSRIDQSLPWEKQVELFCLGYEAAVEAAKDLDFYVFFGFEFGYDGTEFLTYGIDKNFLLAHSDIYDWPIEKYFDKIHEVGGFIVHAHPFRKRPYIKKIRLYTDYIDGVEVENRGNRDPEFNKKALKYALENNLYTTKGTDIHWIEAIGGGMTFNRRPDTIEALIECIKEYKI